MLTKYSVKKPYTVIVGILLVIVLGVIAFTNMPTDLLPKMNMPYIVVYTTDAGATPEAIETSITRPMEASFATLTGIKNISSTSSENVSVITMEFDASTNMDTVLIEISSKVDLLSGDWDDSVSAPVVMKINPDMLPVSIATVNYEGMDIYALSEYVEDTLVPEFEGIEGVASVSASGLIREEVVVTIDQSRIDVLNSAILREVDEELAEVEQELNTAQEEISSGRNALASARRETLGQIDDAIAQLAQGKESLPLMIEGAKQQKTELQTQLDGVNTAIEQLEQLGSLTPEQQEQLNLLNQQLATLNTQKTNLENSIAQLKNVTADPDAQVAYDSAVERRDQLTTQRESLAAYIDDLKLLDPTLLQAEIDQLQTDIPLTEAALAAANQQKTELAGQKQQIEENIESIEAAIETLTATPAPDGEPTPTPVPDSEPTPTPVPDGEPTPTPVPDGEPTPTPVPDGEPTPTPVPDGEPTPTPVPNDEPVPVSDESTDKDDTPDNSNEPDNNTPNNSEEQNEPDGNLLALLGFNTTAYADGEDLETLLNSLAEAQEQLGQIDQALTAADGAVATLTEKLTRQQNRLATCTSALDELTQSGGGEDVQSRIDEMTAQIETIDAELVTLNETISALENQLMSDEERQEAITTLETQLEQTVSAISAITGSPAYQALLLASDQEALQQKFAELNEAKGQLEAGIAQLDEAIAKLEQGIIPAGFIPQITEDTDVEAALEQLREGRRDAAGAFSEISEELNAAADEVGEARLTFEEERDKALENAGLDGVITLEMISGILAAQNFDMPAGYIHEGDDSFLVRVGEEFSSLTELKTAKLFTLGLESVQDVRLLDVARVEIADNSGDVFTKVDGTDGVILTFQKQSTHSTADVADRITETANALMEKDPALSVTELMNQGMYIDIVIDSVLNNLMYGAVLAIIVLLLFLMDIRPTIVVALSIPLSVVIAFVAMFFADISLNVISLSGLALGIGMLVDNSIVAIENIYRLHNEEGIPILRACVDGVKQVSGALFSSTLTTICVFLPFVFFDGLAKDLFMDLGLTIAFSLLASLLVALTVVPSMSATFLKRTKKKEEKGLARLLRNAYVKLLSGALRVKLLVILVAVGLLVYSANEALDMDMIFMPEVASDQMTVTLPENTDLNKTEQEEQILQVMEGIMKVDGVESVGVSTDGDSTIMSAGSGVTFYITLDPESERTNAEIAEDMRDIGRALSLELGVSTSTMDISMLSGEGISVNISGRDLGVLRALAQDLAGRISTMEGVTDISDGLEDSVPELSIIVDKDKANAESLTVAQVYQFIATKLVGPVEVTRITLNDKEYTVSVVNGADQAITPRDLENLEIEVRTEDESNRVRIGDIAVIEDRESLSSINRKNQVRQITVSFNVLPGYSLTDANAALAVLMEDFEAPEGYDVSLSGENETVLELLENLILVIGIGFVFIFLIMVAQFQSFKSPFIVLFTIPLAFTGGFLALMLTKMDLSVVAMVGFLVLSGVVVNNGIVFVDAVNQLRIGGMEKREAILEAGRMRVRPILMTALTTILGMFTMALGTGMGAEMMQPMAIVSIGGLAYATLMTLFIVPVLYDIFNGKKMKAREIEMIRESAGLRTDEEVLNEGAVEKTAGNAASEEEN